MPRYVLTGQANADVREIVTHIARRNRDAARMVRVELRDAMRELAAFPGMGHTREDLTPEPLRFWAVYSYLIVYVPDSSPLQVIAVAHGARNLEAELRRRTRGRGGGK